ncbi:hypothetical protein [Massilia putida]|uniref:hypothetical protein n=1 Tax=Massilia putida TaxID=1141883 RepID=UPI0012EB50FA|nr:hypothetical protein [Massilia putida]
MTELYCVACEGKPAGTNNPCAVCGRATPPSPSTAPTVKVDEREARGSIGDYAQFHTLLDATFEACKVLDTACGGDAFLAADKLTEAQNRLVEYIDTWAGRAALSSRPAGEMELPPLPLGIGSGEYIHRDDVRAYGRECARAALAPKPVAHAANEKGPTNG